MDIYRFIGSRDLRGTAKAELFIYHAGTFLVYWLQNAALEGKNCRMAGEIIDTMLPNCAMAERMNQVFRIFTSFCGLY